MSKFYDAIAKYKTVMEGMGIKVDEDLLTKVTKALGPSIYKSDASIVSCSDKAERDRIRERFLIGKLGLPKGKALDDAIESVCQEMGTGNKQKHRAIFNYLLVKKLKQESKF